MNKIMRKVGIAVMSLAVVATIGVFPVVAQQEVREVDVRSVDDVLAIVRNVIDLAFTFFFLVAAFFILWAGFSYLTSAGDDKKIGAAKNRLMYAAVGILIALVARSIPWIIESLIVG